MAKLTITKEQVAASQQERKVFSLTAEVGGLNPADIASALRTLADHVEGYVPLSERVARCRDRVGIETRTRLPVFNQTPQFPVMLGNVVLGSASIVTVPAIRPTPKGAALHLFDLTALDEPTFEDGPYQEDDEVEFWRQDVWHHGIVVDRSTEHTYIVEDDAGRRWEVSVHAIRGAE